MPCFLKRGQNPVMGALRDPSVMVGLWDTEEALNRFKGDVIRRLSHSMLVFCKRAFLLLFSNWISF